MARLIPMRRTAADLYELGDEALVAACGTGDMTALAVLFDRFGRDVYRFLVRLGGVDDHTVDDLVQDTFLKVHEGARRFEGRSSVRTWILAVAGNVAKTHVRGDVRQKERGRAFVERHHSDATGPELATERRELMQRLNIALQTLPHEQRVAFVMCDVEELRGVDVAKALGIREGTLYRRLHDARKALRSAVLGDKS